MMKKYFFLILILSAFCLLSLTACSKTVEIDQKAVVRAELIQSPQKCEIPLTQNQQKTILQILNGKTPDKEPGNCAADIRITVGTDVYTYHRDCGNIQIQENQRQFTLSPEEQQQFLTIFGQPR